jgi:hypothetical protein
MEMLVQEGWTTTKQWGLISGEAELVNESQFWLTISKTISRIQLKSALQKEQG